MPGTAKRVGPTLLTLSSVNILNGGGGDVTKYDILTHIHIANRTGAAAKASVFIGASLASAAGTEIYLGFSIPGNGVTDYYCRTPMKSTDFLTALSDTSNALVITVDSEQYIVP